MEYQFTYLLLGIIYLFFWIIFFIWKKETRKEMIIISIIFAVIGPFIDFFYTIDWWKPHFLFGFSYFGIEDVLFGFTYGGIAAIIYKILFQRKSKNNKSLNNKDSIIVIHLLFIISLTAFLFLVSFIVIGLNSLFSTTIALFFPTLLMWRERKDLIISSVATGIIMILLAFASYTVLKSVYPSWISNFWSFDDTPILVILNVPFNDIIWYFITGLYIVPLYEYSQASYLINS
ncbi:MAG: hypothetical protein JXB49_31720 [Bacteroidales bacterium]|nr:hypothetical protein [Bacteroidales bacterium]